MTATAPFPLSSNAKIVTASGKRLGSSHVMTRSRLVQLAFDFLPAGNSDKSAAEAILGYAEGWSIEAAIRWPETSLEVAKERGLLCLDLRFLLL